MPDYLTSLDEDAHRENVLQALASTAAQLVAAGHEVSSAISIAVQVQLEDVNTPKLPEITNSAQVDAIAQRLLEEEDVALEQAADEVIFPGS